MTIEEARLFREWQLYFKRLDGVDALTEARLVAAHENALSGVPVPLPPSKPFVVPTAPRVLANPISRAVVRGVLGPKGLAAVAIALGTYAALCQWHVCPASVCVHREPVVALLESVGAYDLAATLPTPEVPR